MTAHTCSSRASLADLVDYHRGELSDEAAARVEDAYFSCGACASLLAWITSLDDRITSLVRSGALTSGVTGALLDRAVRDGVRLRSYRLAPGTQVACTAAPDDDFVVVRLATSAEAGDSVTLRTEAALLDTGTQSSHTTEDVPIDRTTGEIIVAYSGDWIRSVPRSRWTVHATIRGLSGERSEGPYVLDHTPWHELVAPPET